LASGRDVGRLQRVAARTRAVHCASTRPWQTAQIGNTTPALRDHARQSRLRDLDGYSDIQVHRCLLRSRRAAVDPGVTGDKLILYKDRGVALICRKGGVSAPRPLIAIGTLDGSRARLLDLTM
jgi:hypothetical protein